MEVVGVKFRVRPRHQDININKFGHIVLLKLDCMSLDLARHSSLLCYFRIILCGVYHFAPKGRKSFINIEIHIISLYSPLLPREVS